MPDGDRVLRLQSRLTDRDWQLLTWLADHQVLTTPQISSSLFGSLRFAQRRLLALYHLGLVDRFRALRPGGGSYPWHYVLGHAGAELIAATRDEPPPRPSETARRIRRIATNRTLDHRLGVNQFFTDLAAHARTHPGSSLERWWSEAQCAAPGAFGPGLISPIRPDGHGVYSENGRRGCFYLEYDTGGEDHGVLVRKIARYNEHVAKGGPRWPVLFWFPTTARERHLHEHLRDVDVAVTVATATHDDHDDTDPTGARWLVRGHPHGPLRLIEVAHLESGN
jgi:hypothetical protein